MNVAFLLGNGFDLQLGMETGYKSFLAWYVDQPTTDSDISQFRAYLKDEKGEWWSDAEIAMGQYLGNFSDDNIAIYFKNIRDFKLRLSEYLTYENERYDLEDSQEVIDTFKDFLLKSANDIMLRPTLLRLNDLRTRNDTLIHFITFNYTDALDRIISKVKENQKALETFSTPSSVVYRTNIGNIYHIHGTLDSSLIMGVDNYEQLNASQISDFTKVSRTLIKPIVNDELGRDEHENATSMVYNCQFLFFYGLSFGSTDKTWWDLIKDRLIKDGNLQVVIFTRSSDDDIQTIIPEDILDYVNDKKDEFLGKLGITPGSNYYDTVRKRVFVIRNTKRLNISIKDRKIPVNV